MLPAKRLKMLGQYALLPKHYFEKFRYKTRSQQDLSIANMGPKTPTDAHKQSEKLIKVADTASEVLLKVDSVFPLMLFPDTLSVDRQKLTITHRSFFNTQITNVQICDIQIIEADVGPFFGSLRITSTQFSGTVYKIHFLTRNDVIRAQRLLQGFVVAKEKDIDCSSIGRIKLTSLINDLGRGNSS